MMKRIIKVVLIIILCCAFSCSSNDDANTNADLILNTISPTSGPRTTIVTINGSGFGENLNAVSVFFNEIEAEVLSVMDTEIRATVPSRAFTGIVRIDINGRTVEGPEFTYIVTTYNVSTIAGNGNLGFVDGNGSEARFNFPTGVAVDQDGNIIVADFDNNAIRRITPSGEVSTIAGNVDLGFEDGNGSDARFRGPGSVAIDQDGNIIVADAFNHAIRRITPSGVVSTLAGNGDSGLIDGSGAIARFNFPTGVYVDQDGNIIVADFDNNTIRRITPSGEVSTIAGTSVTGFDDGNGSAARFNGPSAITIDQDGNIIVTDRFNDAIRLINPSNDVSTITGGAGGGFTDGSIGEAMFNNPARVTIDLDGNIIVTDQGNHVIRIITPSGEVSTIAGNGTAGFVNGSGNQARFNAPSGIAIDQDRNIIVADPGNHVIRRITLE